MNDHSAPSTPDARATATRLPAALRSLRHRNYRLFFGGQLISLCGTWMQSVAQSWLVYRLTGSAVLLGLVGFASQFPVFLASPAGGVVADRLNRRRVLLVTQTASMVLALALATLTLTHVVQIWHVFLMAALLGMVNAIDMPTRGALVADMVPRDDLMNAIALNSSMMNGARIVGPAIAGLLVAAIGEGWCFLLNGLSYVAVLGGLTAMRLPPRVAPPSQASHLAHIIEGFRYVAGTPPVRTLLILMAVVSLLGTPYVVLMPIFAAGVLHGGPDALGLLMGASGLGALSAALTLASRTRMTGLSRWIAMAAVGLSVSLVAFTVSRVLWLSTVLLVPVGFSMMIQMAGTNTLIQAMVPDHLRGRVMAVYTMMFMGMAPLGAILAGILAEHVGAPLAVAAGAAAVFVAALVFATRVGDFREQARAIISKRGT